MKKLLVFLFVLAMLPVQAGFFDDLFSSDEDGDDRGPFYFKIQDSLNNDNEVSFEDRRLTVRVFFYTRFYNNISNRDEDDLEEFFNSNLEVVTQKEKNGSKDKLGQGLTFKFKNLPEIKNNRRYSSIVFESSKINITESQKLIFRFDQRDFAQDLGFNINDNNRYRRSFNFKPINIELNTLELAIIDSQTFIIGDFATSIAVDPSQELVSFDLFRKGKSVKSIAKKGRRKLRLDAELAELSDYLTKLDSGRYRVRVPVDLSLRNSNKSINAEDIFNVKLPLLIEAQTESGLELKIKALIKTKISNFLSSN
jgi:hypothetical protein